MFWVYVDQTAAPYSCSNNGIHGAMIEPRHRCDTRAPATPQHLFDMRACAHRHLWGVRNGEICTKCARVMACVVFTVRACLILCARRIACVFIFGTQLNR